MLQAFAKKNAASITLIYYCFTGLIAFVVTVYLWYKDQKNKEKRSEEERVYQERRQNYDREYHERRKQEDLEREDRRRQEDREHQDRRRQEDREHQDRRRQGDQERQDRRRQEDREHQDRRRQEDREHQDRRDQEDRRDYRRREWRQFSDRINADYGKLRNEDILQKISKVKYTFERMRIQPTVTGLDVLRYMLTDDNYRNLVSESPQLKALREDLHMIFLSLNLCSSLLDLGEVPGYIEEEVRPMVDELGNVAEPFLTGEQQRVALKCLEHFGSNRSSNEHGQRRVEELGVLINDIVPYVNILHFTPEMSISNEDCDYSKCRIFFCDLKDPKIRKKFPEDSRFLLDLHEDLESKAHSAEIFGRKLVDLPVTPIEEISDSDRNEVISMKALHEVRLYIYLILSDNLPIVDNELAERNKKILRQLYEKGKKVPLNMTEIEIKRLSTDFIRTLETIKKYLPEEIDKQALGTELEQSYQKIRDLIIVSGSR